MENGIQIHNKNLKGGHYKNASSGLFEYLRCLNTSPSFREKIKIRKKECLNGKTVDEMARYVPPDSMDDIMKEYCIPITATNRDLLLKYMYNQVTEGMDATTDEFNVIYCLASNSSNKHSVSIYEPAILIKINSQIGIKKWMEIWKTRIKKGHKKVLGFETKNMSINSLKKSFQKQKTMENIDELLFVYRKSVIDHCSTKKISMDISNIIEKGNIGEKGDFIFNSPHDEHNIARMLRKIKSIIAAI